MAKIIIRNIAQLKAFNQKLRSLSVTLPTLQMKALERAADEAVLTDIHTDMASNNFSKKIIDATFVGPIQILSGNKGATIHFISDYTADDGFDVSSGREEGTTHPNPTFPKKPDGWLTWIDKDTGKRVFRRQSHPSGIERLLIIEKNIAINQQRFVDVYKQQIAASINQMVTV